MSQKRFENFPKALPSKQRASIFTVVKGEVVTQRAKPLTIVKILAMTAGRERPKEYLMNLKLRQICVHQMFQRHYLCLSLQIMSNKQKKIKTT